MNDIVLSRSRERIEIELRATRVGGDLLVLITGGNGHIGAVGAGTICGGLATSSVITIPGHRDDRLAKDAAEKLAKKLGCNCVVTAGVHFDDITPAEIRDALALSESLVDELIDALLAAELKI